MKNSEKEQILEERNDKSKAFRENWNEQLKRDQVVMPTEDLPLEDIREEYQEEKNGEKIKDQSSSDKKKSYP
ncbi:hypothetical protein CVD28_11405 [Bacillus sp. M6-12]|uniref:hypothetical protein n=1 Tax=Bacillus sp. M6-12 TaxID=2054166 RepID=UPI000C77F957|nr:hypothetical protein [Bacillus sp. M6-12]PLS17593.1 hypothetical protein CVD28_11405 [Bacillus sp. M6-12]